MYAIIDHRTPWEVKQNLAKYVTEIFEFSSDDITHDAISGHPDIFMFQFQNQLILAPNTPKLLVQFLDAKSISYTFGINLVGKSLDESVLYNCVATNTHFYGKPNKADKAIQKLCASQKPIDLPQSFTRCSMLPIDEYIITSDKGIGKVLEKNAIDYFYFDPSEIHIKGHKNGFIGGTMGVLDHRVFFLGNLLKHKDGLALQNYLSLLGKEVIHLGTDYLYDGGGIFFIENS